MMRTWSPRARFVAGAVGFAVAGFLAVQLAGGDDRDSVATAAPQSPGHIPARQAARSAGSAHHSTRLAIEVPAGANPALFVKDHHHAKIRTAPGGGALVTDVRSHTPWGSRTTLAVTGTEGDWAQVLTPDLQNGQPGWVKLDRRRLGYYSTYSAIEVDLSTRTATLITDGSPAGSFSVSIGAPGTDTPVGQFAVTDTFRGLTNPDYGCCALALTAHQPSLPTGWLGGNRIAIHGTFETVGYAVSHGCIRAANSDVRRLVSHVQIGSLVDIHE